MNLQKGDRVQYKLPGRVKFITGIIDGESCNGHAWVIIKDGTQNPREIHKVFCQPVDDEQA